MRPDFRRLCLALVGVVALAAPAVADDPGRFALSPSRDGFVRLDTATGAVSHCRPTDGVWRCEPLATDNARLDALAADLAKVTAAVAALDARVAALAPVSKNAEPIAAESEPNEGPSVINQTLARLLDFVRVLKHGRADPA